MSNFQPQHRYQEVPTNPQTPNAQKQNANRPTIQNYNMNDEEFFNNLKLYKPLCYSGKGSPLFLVNKGWYLSLGCVMVMNALFLIVIFLFLRQGRQGPKPMSDQDVRKFTIINASCMAVLNLTYFLTQFLNPGIRNLSRISQQEYNQDGSFYCSRCNGNRTEKMEHCTDCEVCIDGLDHHCGFFSKCIGGWQKFAFYAFLALAFLSFLSLIVTMASNIGL